MLKKYSSCAVLSVIATSAAMAQNMPNAGQSVQQMQAPVQPLTSKPLQLPRLPDQSAAAGVPGSAKVTLQTIRLSGLSVLTEKELLDVLGDYKGQSFDFQGLEQLAARLANHYHQQGYPFASATLPAQDLKEGVLQIEIIEGRYGAVTPSGEFLQSDAAPFLAALKPGDVIEAKQLERTMLILDDLPMISVSPRVRPGQAYGTGDLDVLISRNVPWDGELGVDNLGNRFTGEYRAKGTLNAYSKFIFGDMLRLSAITTNANMWLGSADYEMPLNGTGLRGQVGYARTSYQLGYDYAALGASGVADVYSGKLSNPLVRTQVENLSVSLGYVEKHLYDRYDYSGTQSNKRSHLLPLTFYFDKRDAFAGGGLTYGNMVFTRGQLGLDAALSAADVISAQTQGGFSKFNFEIARLQTLPADFTFFARYQYQSASKNLDSSEKFNLGGIYGVRAYPIGEGLGDRGWLTQFELRHKFDDIMGFVLLDTGASSSNIQAWDGHAVTTSRLTGRGFGVRLQQEKGWNWEASVSWRQTGLPVSDTARRDPRLWAFATYKFN